MFSCFSVQLKEEEINFLNDAQESYMITPLQAIGLENKYPTLWNFW